MQALARTAREVGYDAHLIEAVEAVNNRQKHRLFDKISNHFGGERNLAGKTIAIFGLPGAYTPTCSAKHVPGYVEKFNQFKAAGVDEIWCVSVNDAFVMGAWARDQKTEGKVRMLADGSADFAKATGLTLDLTARGMGLRSNRYSMLVKNGQVTALNIEGPGKFEVSDAGTLLAQAQA